MNDTVGYRLDSDADRRLRRFKRSAAFDQRASILGAVMLRSSTAMLALTAAIASSAISMSVRPAIAADSPPEVVRKLTDAVIAVLEQKDLPAAARVTKIRDVVYDYADFPTISRLVLARNWRGLDETQQERFVEEFKKYLSISYGKNVDTYNNEKVEIVGDRDEGRDDWTVQTKNLRPQGGGDVLWSSTACGRGTGNGKSLTCSSSV